MNPAKKHIPVLAAFCLLVAFACAQSPFVGVKDGHFVLKGRPYYFAGANMWYAGLLAAGVQGEAGKQRLARELDFLQQKGITNIRVMLGAEGMLSSLNGVRPVHPALQPRQGQFDETLFRGIDFLLAQLDRRGMKAVLFFSNNWEWSGGFLQYLVWNGRLDSTAVAPKLSWDDYRDDTRRFYDCPECIDAYSVYVRRVLERENPLTGKKYTEEPAVMAWEIANEPRPMRPASDSAYARFLRGAAALLKSLDKNHLVTLGTEGVMGTESEALYEAIHRDPSVDYCTIHIWPKNWRWFTDTAIAASRDNIARRSEAYIRLHGDIAARLGKPLVLEEFGLPRDGHSFDITAATSQRDAWYADIFGRLQQSAQEGGVLAGVNFWTMGGEARPIKGQVFWKEGDSLQGDPPMEEQGLNAVFDSDDSTWKIIASVTQKINALYGATRR